MKRFEWVDATSTDDAFRQATKPAADLSVATRRQSNNGAVIKAGGIDLLDLMKEGVIDASRLVNIRSIESLHGAGFEKQRGMTIGPLMTLTEIAEHKEIRSKYRALSDAADHIATPNIRNAATIGGNLLQRPRCWYFRSEDFNCLKKGGTDCPALAGENKFHAIFGNDVCAIVHPSTAAVALVALNATIELSSGSGKREISLEEFFISPEKDVLRENTLAAGEIITAIYLPSLETKSAHVKLGEKDSFDWSTGDCAVALEMDGKFCKKASVVLGAAAPVPYRATEAEEFLQGKPMEESVAREAGRLAVQKAKPLAQNHYKVQMLTAATTRALLAAMR